MNHVQRSDKAPPLISAVRRRMGERIAAIGEWLDGSVDTATLMGGKCLRSLLAARLHAADASGLTAETLEGLCLATEMVHAASLCHDDVIDGAQIRRAAPALWNASGTSAAVLIGDLLLCDAMDLMVGIDQGRYLRAFLATVRHMVEAETEQELLMRGKDVDAAACLRVARAKTGSLFAFVASVCGGDDQELCRALERAGCDLGTAYQLADDLCDLLGDEDLAGKTLRTDQRRGTGTMPQVGPDGWRQTRRQIHSLRDSAIRRLQPYAKMQAGLSRFLADDFEPILNRLMDVASVCKEHAV